MKTTAVVGDVIVDPGAPRETALEVVARMLVPASEAICNGKGEDFALVYWAALLNAVGAAAGERVPEIASAFAMSEMIVVDGGTSRH
jgi:hypothetical protein